MRTIPRSTISIYHNARRTKDKREVVMFFARAAVYNGRMVVPDRLLNL